MNDTTSQIPEEKIKEAVAAFDDFTSTMDDLSKTHQAVIDETNRQLELEKIEVLRKQNHEGK